MRALCVLFILHSATVLGTIEHMTFSKDLKVVSNKEQNISAYLALYKQFSKTLGPAGCWKEGEIEIVLDPAKIKEIETKTKQNLMMKKGLDEKEAEKWSRIGIIAEDGYWMWVRDAVIFPSGMCGTYNRILWKTALQSPPGVAVVPVLPSKKIVLNLNFRHATRSWEIELPRGARKWGETLEDSAIRELEEETGYLVKKPVFIGKMATDSGLSTTLVPIYLAEVSQRGEVHQDYSEAIKQNLAFSKEELKRGIARGYLEIEINGQMVKVPCRDSFVAFALLIAETKGLL